MTDPTPQDQILAIGRDDALLDALGRGEFPDEPDNLAELLAAWRADMADEPPHTATIRDAYPAAAGPEPAPGRVRRRAGRRFAPATRRVRLAVAAAVAAAVVGGVVIASGNATPGSPLWPISKVVNPARADRVAAEDALAQARRAIDERHLTQARDELNQAAALISRVRDPQQAARLRTELDQLRQMLAAVTAGVPLPPLGTGQTPAPSASPGGGATGGGASGGGSTGGPGSILPPILPGQGTHSSGGSGGGGLLPTLPPLPSLLPSLLPTLPLHIGG